MDIENDLIAGVDALMREAAATHVLPRFGELSSGEVDTKSGPHDLVTVADREAEIAMTPALEEILRGSVVVGEEAASADPSVLDRLQGDAPVWLVDPVDGTANFVDASPRFGMMVALVHQRVTQAGWIYFPLSGEMVFCRRGGGAFIDGVRLAPSGRAPFAKSRVDYSARYVAEPHRSLLMEKLSGTAHQRQGRCSAYAYVDVAKGELDMVVQYLMSPWDHAAGALLLDECGGATKFIDTGEAYSPVARDPRILLASRHAADWAPYRDAIA